MVTVKLAALLGLLGVAVFTDLRARRIPNWLTVTGVLGGLTFASLEVGGFPVIGFLLLAQAFFLFHHAEQLAVDEGFAFNQLMFLLLEFVPARIEGVLGFLLGL